MSYGHKKDSGKCHHQNLKRAQPLSALVHSSQKPDPGFREDGAPINLWSVLKMDKGYFKIWRKLREHPIMRDPNALTIFLHFLNYAEWKDGRKTYLGNAQIILKAGQLTTGRRQIAQELNMTEQTVREALKRLFKKYEIATIKTTNKNSLISILNWEKYQYETTSNATSKQPNNNQQTTTSEEYKHITYKKEDSNPKRLTARLPDTEFLMTLRDNPAYKGVDIDRELAKMDSWLSTRPGRKKTRRFVVSWLNKAEVPVPVTAPIRRLGEKPPGLEYAEKMKELERNAAPPPKEIEDLIKKLAVSKGI
jgi:hypothetical protein